MRAWRSLPPGESQRLAADPWALAEWIDSTPESKARQLRHILLHLLFPEEFERISSGRNKREIVLRLRAKYLPSANQLDLNNRTEVDKALLVIRRAIEKERGEPVDFYQPDVRELWDAGADGPITPPAKPPEGADKQWCRERFGDARVWAVACGAGGFLWPEFKRRGCIAIGWADLGDLSEYSSRDEITKTLQGGEGAGDSVPYVNALACWQFAREMSVGDVVLAKTGRDTLLGWGRVSSDYRYDPSAPDFPNLRDVQWARTGPWKLGEDQWITSKTLTDVTPYPSWLKYSFGLIDGGPQEQIKPALYTVTTALAELFLTGEHLTDILETLGRKKNLILEGPPGVGKTFVARRLARVVTQSDDGSRIASVQFHQSYSYEDFVQGWRPGPGGTFVRRDGVFLDLCRRAAADRERPYVLLIDEINRANLSKVLGEVMLLIEGDKRGPEYAVRLTYATQEDPPFFISDNVHIIGMMNTADRSLAMVDYALRRRFAFHYLRPAFGTEAFAHNLKQAGVEEPLIQRIVDRVSALNAVIRSDSANLGSGYEIGHSYFCPGQGDDSLDERWYQRIVRTEVEPLLREYWFDQPAKAEQAVRDLLK